MKEFCENQFCENPGAKDVPVSSSMELKLRDFVRGDLPRGNASSADPVRDDVWDR